MFKEKTDIINKILLANLCFLLSTWVLFIATPFDIMANNPEEFFGISAWSILKISIKYMLYFIFILNIALLFIFLLFRKFIIQQFIFILFASSISIWINSTILVGTYGIFDGRGAIEINRFGLLNFFQITIFLMMYAGINLFKKNKKQLTLLLSILLISISVSVFNISSYKNNYNENKAEISDLKKLFIYSNKNPNILFIILDEYQTDLFEYILNENIKEKLDGFIWFSDASSNFPTTVASMPAIFSSNIYKNEIKLKEFYKKSGDNSIAIRLDEEGFEVTYTEPPSSMAQNLFPKNNFVMLQNINEKNISSYFKLLNYSIFRSVPDAMKPEIYNNEKWFIKYNMKHQTLSAGRDKSGPLKSLKYLATEKFFIIKDYKPTLKFHHSILTHSPTILDENCNTRNKLVEKGESFYSLKNKSMEGLCAIKQILKTINNIKESGAYDNTMIIISSDHGSFHTPKNMKNKEKITPPYSRAASTLLIKPFRKSGNLTIDPYHAQLSDIPKTIADALNLTNDYKGINLLAKIRPKNRERLFHYYDYLNPRYTVLSQGKVLPIISYKINGPLNNSSSWNQITYNTVPCNQKISFSKYNHKKYYYFKNLSHIEHWGRWSNHDYTIINISPKKNCNAKAIKFNLSAFVNHKNKIQSSNVYINNKFVDKITIEYQEQNPKEFIFQIHEGNHKKIKIRFEIKNPLSPTSIGISNDSRVLGLGFIDMQLMKKE